MNAAPGNAPRPLANAPIPLLRDPRIQMSFGERAALEGVLAQLWPRLALEVGTADGGSLERVACYSDEAHAFDEALPDSDVLAPAHVHMHVGDSHRTLAPWLDELAADERQLDFALLDGDHEPRDAALDLVDLLSSKAALSTVILLHDTGNLGVRDSLEAIDLSFHPRVVYYDLDFVTGHEFAQGPFHGQRWGGLGLIVTGDRASDGYGASPAQNLYRKRATHG